MRRPSSPLRRIGRGRAGERVQCTALSDHSALRGHRRVDAVLSLFLPFGLPRAHFVSLLSVERLPLPTHTQAKSGVQREAGATGGSADPLSTQARQRPTDPTLLARGAEARDTDGGAGEQGGQGSAAQGRGAHDGRPTTTLSHRRSCKRLRDRGLCRRER